MKRRSFSYLTLLILFLFSCNDNPENQIIFSVNIPSGFSDEKVDGRLLIMFSTEEEGEPRFQINDGPKSQQVFGIDVENWDPATPLSIKAEDLYGYPIKQIDEFPSGTYYVQSLLNVYEEFTLGNGKKVLLPPDKGEGQQWNRKPGNPYNETFKLTIDTQKSANISITLDQIIPEIEPPSDTEFIKHIQLKSEKLSAFWGRDMYLGAHVLLPKGFDEHPEARYPLMVFHGHFPYDFGGFRVEPPDEELEPDYSARFGISGYNKIVQEEEHQFYKTWMSDTFPRFIIIKIQHANPYYDDSYAVNSANLGPYGDAITYELIPHIEEQFRGIGEGWSRFLYGGSTGGWEALAAQVMYPKEYNGCFAACPDPIDFRAYTQVNLYEDQNAYLMESQFKKEVLRPGHRNYLGVVDASLRDMNLKELALGTKSRSGQQYDIWEAVYSPMGEDGYPKRIWDKQTGEIDQEVAQYWKEKYDLRYILESRWEELGPDLEGKINIYCGDMDNYYLNNAVYLMEDFLESTTNPYYNGEVAYGDRAEHCWNGAPDLPNHISRLRYNTLYVPKILQRIEESAPEGADLQSWRY